MVRFIISTILLLIFSESFGQKDSLNNNVLVKSHISLGGAFQTGNVNLITGKFTFDNTINYRSIKSNSYIQYTFNKTFNNIIQNDIFMYEVLSYKGDQLFYPKISGMFEKSKIKSINYRYILGAGIGCNILTKPKYKLAIINSFVFEKTEFELNKLLDYQGIRYSVILKGNYILLNEKLIIKHNLFFHPLIHNAKNNYRFRFLITSVLPISKRLSVQINFDYNSESIVDSGYNPENVSTTFGFSYKFE